MQLILYSKPGCHLCEGVEDKLQQVEGISLHLEIRDITTREDWFAAYQFEIPVLFVVTGTQDILLPRLSPRATVKQWEKQLHTWAENYDIPLDGT